VAVSGLLSHLLWMCLPGLVVDLVSESRRVDDGERDAGAFLVELYGDGLDLNALLHVGDGRVVDLLVAEHLLAAERVDEGGAAGT
jgi:hypothetical protein